MALRRQQRRQTHSTTHSLLKNLLSAQIHLPPQTSPLRRQQHRPQIRLVRSVNRDQRPPNRRLVVAFLRHQFNRMGLQNCLGQVLRHLRLLDSDQVHSRRLRRSSRPRNRNLRPPLRTLLHPRLRSHHQHRNFPCQSQVAHPNYQVLLRLAQP